MKAAFRITRIAGIDINVHVTFGVILALGALQWGARHGALFGAALTAMLFVCVALHELGHSLVARRFGLKVSEIVLLPIGGVAMVSGRPREPAHEMQIALAGPAVNVAIAAVLAVATGALFGLDAASTLAVLQPEAPPSLHAALVWLLGANVGLVVFNMIPALPLDGGRVLRAGLSMVVGPARATSAAASVGQLIAVVLFAIGMMAGQLFLALIAGMIFLGAGRERLAERASAVLGAVPVRRAYNRTAIVLLPGERVSRAAEHILTSYQPDFAVVLGEELLGVVTRSDVIGALAAGVGDPYIAGVMRRDVVRVDAEMSLDEVARTMSEKKTPLVAVYDGESYLGLVSQEDIAEALLLLQFMPAPRHDRSARPAAAGEEWT
jgi:Zn-dependent protease